MQMGDAGTIPPAKPTEKSLVSTGGAAEIAALDADRAIVVSAWPELARRFRSIIVEIARAAHS
jgi:hypothetical protein